MKIAQLSPFYLPKTNKKQTKQKENTENVLGNSQFNSTPKALELGANYNKGITFKGCIKIEPSSKTKIGYLNHCTLFFREPETDEFVQNYIRRHFSSQDKIKIVSGACSSGDEAKSYSIMLDDLKDKIEISGFDIDENIVKEAKNPNTQLVIEIQPGGAHENFLLNDFCKLTPYEKACKDKFKKYYSIRRGVYKNGAIIYRCKNKRKIKNCNFKTCNVLDLSKQYASKSVDVLLYRNALYHSLCELADEQRKKAQDADIVMNSIAFQMNKIVKKGGLVVFGEKDNKQGVDPFIVSEAMLNNGFEAVKTDNSIENETDEFSDVYTNVWKKIKDIK